MPIERFEREVTIKCSNCGRDIVRPLKNVPPNNEFNFCEDCWPERKRELDRASYWRNVTHVRARKRANDARARGAPPTCLWPGCTEPRAYRHQKYCKPHSLENYSPSKRPKN